jgi:hypothetical protein
MAACRIMELPGSVKERSSTGTILVLHLTETCPHNMDLSNFIVYDDLFSVIGTDLSAQRECFGV